MAIYSTNAYAMQRIKSQEGNWQNQKTGLQYQETPFSWSSSSSYCNQQ